MQRSLYLLLLLLPTPRRHTPLGLRLLLLSQQPLRDRRGLEQHRAPGSTTDTPQPAASSPVTGRSEKAGLTGTVDSAWLPVVGQRVGSGHRCLVHTSVMILEPATHARAEATVTALLSPEHAGHCNLWSTDARFHQAKYAPKYLQNKYQQHHQTRNNFLKQYLDSYTQSVSASLT